GRNRPLLRSDSLSADWSVRFFPERLLESAGFPPGVLEYSRETREDQVGVRLDTGYPPELRMPRPPRTASSTPLRLPTESERLLAVSRHSDRATSPGRG